MEWKIVQRDFVERTLIILEQYDEYVRPKSTAQEDVRELEVTLLVNCLLGLMVVPYEYAHRGNPPGSVQICRDDTIALKDLPSDWGLQNVQIDRICGFDHKPIVAVGDATLRIFLYRMRNSIAHSRFEDSKKVVADGIGVIYQVAERDPNKSRIEKLIFQDKDNRFRAIITVTDVRKFAEKFARVILGQA